jgi:hypothetical protein
MTERLENIDVRIFYAYIFIIMILAIVRHPSTDETLSIITIFLIVVLALSNISYLYLKLKHTRR